MDILINNKYYKYSDIHNKTKTINELFDNLEPSFYKCNNKLISGDTYISSLCIGDARYIEIEKFNILKGGEDFLDMILKPIEIIFSVIFKPIGAIGNVFIFLLQLLIWFVKFIYWAIFFLIWLLTDLLNPVKLVTDFWNSIILIVVTIFSTIMNVFMGLMAMVTNYMSSWMQGFWGWDQSGLTKRDKQSNYFKGIDRKKGKKCYLTNSNTVPFSVLLGTILCPPLGIFMDLGITGWFNILICVVLTLLYYIPGLFYALLVIYS